MRNHSLATRGDGATVKLGTGTRQLAMKNSEKRSVVRYDDIRCCVLAFLDLKAGVENSDEDNDDNDVDETNDFISDAPEVASTAQIPNRDHAEHQELWNTDAESMLNTIMDRYRGSQGSAWKAQHREQRKKHTEGWKTTVAYLPSVADADIWKVAVTPGRELGVVATIFNKVLALNVVGVQSAFYRDAIPGVVYVEANNYGAVLTLLKGINNVWLGYYKSEGSPIDLIPIGERVALLTMDISFVNGVEKGTDEQQRFVRIRNRTRYRNNLGIIAHYDTNARHAFVLVVPRELLTVPNTHRRIAGPPLLQRESLIGGAGERLATMLTSEGIEGLETISAEGQLFSGLEVRRIDVHQLVYSDIHPTARELDLFEATQHDEICRLVNQARSLQIRQGEKFQVTQGPWRGFKGIVDEAMVAEPALTVRLKGRYRWEGLCIELPTEDLVYAAPKGNTTTVKTGLFTGLTGTILEYNDDMVIISPEANADQTIEVNVSDIHRHVDLGDEVEIIQGLLKGRSGFYVAVDTHKARAEIYLNERSIGEAEGIRERMVRVPYECLRTPPDIQSSRLITQFSESGPAPSQLPPNTDFPQESHAMHTGDPFRGLEVVIVDHILKGFEGYIVGSHFVNPPIDDDSIDDDSEGKDTPMLEFEVNKLNHITHYTTRLSAKHLQEKYSGLPIMEAIFLPPYLRRPQVQPKPSTPLPLNMTTRDGSTWEEVAFEFTRDSMSAAHDREFFHWLRNPVMMNKKFQILILESLTDDGSYRTDNAVHGYTVVTEELHSYSERVFVKYEDPSGLTTKKILLKKIIPDNICLRHGERVVVIGPDTVGNEQIVGMAGWVNESPYALGEGVQLVALTGPPGFVYIREARIML
ncbi:hypothetical protein PLEOSDRAFT_1081725 [Pleurotus ostreatus PC15]|uniref:Chromatin elongation factor SPT5 n=1 Tax=Pleurotus ostreatus (strain PC15) TaxID=1137138 RepID=A0A067P143_PLEO1|nr:hypothetical protein PLEOSDRAFT_1081725 [Pleurotus ostreatus PC15]